MTEAELLGTRVNNSGLRGRIRSVAEDFQVIEELGFEPSGTGEHVWLYLRKAGANSEWLARRLARFVGVPARAVSYSGMKDRNALTEQWFSVHLPGRIEPDWQAFAEPGVALLRHTRHDRKIRRGSHKANRFAIVVREIDGDIERLAQDCQRLAGTGVPNYFGLQRFGHDGANVVHAAAMFKGSERVRDRMRRGLYLSAARSLLFNRVLAGRVRESTWNQALPGEVMMLDGSHSIFAIDRVDAEIRRRLDAGDIHPTGPLWGTGEPATRLQAAQLENEMAASLMELSAGLERAGLVQERRALRLPVKDFTWRVLTEDSVELAFRLSAGAYATALLRELFSFVEE